MNKTLQKTLRIFAGCYVGEERLGLLKNTSKKEFAMTLFLVALGFLQYRTDNLTSRIWFSLTEKGKQYVKRFEI